MANFVARNFSSLYDPIRERAGGAYFFTKDGWIKNERCPEAAELRRIDAPDIRKLHRLGLTKEREMYPLLKDMNDLIYLSQPEEHLALFDGLI
jgi:glucose-6-phosphate isomerase